MKIKTERVFPSKLLLPKQAAALYHLKAGLIDLWHNAGHMLQMMMIAFIERYSPLSSRLAALAY